MQYLSKLNIAKVKFLDTSFSHRSICSDDNLAPSEVSFGYRYNSVVGAANYNVRLPKLEITKLSEEIKDWLAFWNQFQRTNDVETVPTFEKFYYLRQSLVSGSRAWH